jgi:hypothetical protein
MIHSIQYGLYDSFLQQAWRYYIAISKKGIYYLLLLLISPIVLFMLGISRFVAKMTGFINPQQLISHLTPRQYRRMMKEYDTWKRMEVIHAHLTREISRDQPLLDRILHRALVKDFSALTTYRQNVMAALDQKLASRDGSIFKSVNHKDLWDDRTKVYAYKF